MHARHQVHDNLRNQDDEHNASPVANNEEVKEAVGGGTQGIRVTVVGHLEHSLGWRRWSPE